MNDFKLNWTEREQWNLEVRGNIQVWEQVLIAYHQWVKLGMPAATAYSLCVEASGKQHLLLPPGGPCAEAPTWVIYEPKE